MWMSNFYAMSLVLGGLPCILYVFEPSQQVLGWGPWNYWLGQKVHFFFHKMALVVLSCFSLHLKTILWTFGQDGGIGRHASPPLTTIKRITTHLKTKYNQNCQKIKLYGSLTTEDLKRKYSSRWVGEVEGEPGQRGHRVAAHRMGGPTFTCGGLKLGGTPG